MDVPLYVAVQVSHEELEDNTLLPGAQMFVQRP